MITILIDLHIETTTRNATHTDLQLGPKSETPFIALKWLMDN